MTFAKGLNLGCGAVEIDADGLIAEKSNRLIIELQSVENVSEAAICDRQGSVVITELMHWCGNRIGYTICEGHSENRCRGPSCVFAGERDGVEWPGGVVCQHDLGLSGFMAQGANCSNRGFPSMSGEGEEKAEDE